MSPDPAISTVETEITWLMRRGEAIHRTARVAPTRALDRAAYLLLRRLAEAGPQNVNALADALALDGSTVTRQVTALERDALVIRERDPKDGRVIRVRPTRSGLARMTAVRAARRELYARVLGEWSAADRELLADLLTRLNDTLERETKALERERLDREAKKARRLRKARQA
jgi:DNA-binding MarR family transcriptional regulator